MGVASIALTIDVEGSISKLPARVDLLLNLFANAGVKATFFILGEVAEAAPQIAKAISRAGHEVGFHGYRHVPIFQLSRLEFVSQLTDWRRRLEDLTQQPIAGFRAPYFSICESTAWALEAVSRAGFCYDSSIYPGMHDRFGWLGAPKQPVRFNGSGLVLFPVPVLCGCLPIGFSGGGYLRLLPWFLVALGFRRQLRKGTLGMIYAHPWEIESPSAKTIHLRRKGNQSALGWRESITGGLGRQRLRLRLTQLLELNRERLGAMGPIVASLDELPEWNPKQRLALPTLRANAEQS